LLCDAELEDFDDGTGRQIHPASDICNVIYTDAFGVSIEIVDEPEPEPIRGSMMGMVIEIDGKDIDLQRWPYVEDVLEDAFQEHGLSRLGGASTGRGWTSYSIFQKCPYAWKRRYIDKQERSLLQTEPSARAIGTLIHAFLALYYTGMMDSTYAQLSPEILHERLAARANPKLVAEAWRCFRGYVLYYADEGLVPLAVEYDLRDPRTGESCRYDLIAYAPETRGALRQGTYFFEHKSASRFDRAALSWENDGEVIGQAMLWKRLGLDLRFGKLLAGVVNIIGKQEKDQKFYRQIIAPQSWQIAGHQDDLRRWEAKIQLARATNDFPRARKACIDKYGLCDYYEHCASNE
jgi:hypothetical protein